MIELFLFALGALVIAALVGWYCHRWGVVDGRAEGYEDGRLKGVMEGAGVVSPFLAGGPRERAGDPSPAFSGGPRERA